MSMFNKLKAMRARMGVQPDSEAGHPPSAAKADASASASSMWDLVADPADPDFDPLDLEMEAPAPVRNEAPKPVQSPEPPASREAIAEPTVSKEIPPAPAPTRAPAPAIEQKAEEKPAPASTPPVTEPVREGGISAYYRREEAPAPAAPTPVVAPKVAPPEEETSIEVEPDLPPVVEPAAEKKLPSDIESDPEPVSLKSFSAPKEPAEPIFSEPEPDFPPIIETKHPAKVDPAPIAEPAKTKRSGRVKTRLIGFDKSSGQTVDVPDPEIREPASDRTPSFPVGWLVVVDGPGRGATFMLGAGVAQIGRDEGQAVQLDFGDETISRANHASIAFDDEQRGFFIGHGGKSNIVRLNGKPVLSTETMTNGDLIKIGETTLRLVALCGETFSWADHSDDNNNNSG